jgi:capsid protein
MNEPALEFVWVGDDAVDPLEQAQTLQILVGAGIKTREEARADLGLRPTAAVAVQSLTDAVASAETPTRASADPSVSGV